jgi:hypothetical protein
VHQKIFKCAKGSGSGLRCDDISYTELVVQEQENRDGYNAVYIGIYKDDGLDVYANGNQCRLM